MTRLYHNLSNNKVLADNYCKGGKIRILGGVMQLLNKSTDYTLSTFTVVCQQCNYFRNLNNCPSFDHQPLTGISISFEETR